MRLARVIGTVTLNRRIANIRRGQWLLVEAFDGQALEGLDRNVQRKNPMPESLVVYDELGAGRGQIIAVSEGAEATRPFYPDRVTIDCYCAAILDHIEC